MAHHPVNPVAPEGRANVFLNGQFFVQLFHRDVSATPAAMGWTRFSYRFRAADTVTRLAIADVTGTWPQGGLVLDGLTVMPIPPNLLINGSFEEPDLSGSTAGRRFVGPGELPGWRFDRGTVDVLHEREWQPAPGQGSQLLHLRGRTDAAGTIEQSFRTEPGRRYVLSGWVSHHPVLREGRANVFINSDLLTQLYHSTALYGPQTPAELRWQPFSYTFRALEATTSLRFLDVTGLSEEAGIMLDGLMVTPSAEPLPGLPPAAPTGLTAQLVSPGQVNLTWLDNSSDETGFEIQRRAGAGEWMRIALVAPNVTRFGDLGVTPGVIYTYRVRAMNESGDSAWSNEAAVTTPGRP
jgi:hypothetical protein